MDDPKIKYMDPIKKMWMFHNWIEDQNDDVELAKNHAYLLGSFINPEAVKKLMGKDGQTFTSSDEEFEASTKLVMDDAKKNKTPEPSKRKRRRKLKG